MSLSSPLTLPPINSAATLPTSASRPQFFYPLNPEWRKTYKNGVLASTFYGWGQGTVYAIWKDTGTGSTSFANAANLLLVSSCFFGLREFAISPLLCQLRLTEDHRRRYLLAKMASPEHTSPDDPPLPPERWGHIRYRRVLDSGLTAGICGIALPKWHRWMLHKAGYDALIRLTPRAIAIGFSTPFVVVSALQLLYNSYTIHDFRLHSAYDEIGPIPGIDIARVRAQEKADVERLALLTEYAIAADKKKLADKRMKDWVPDESGWEEEQKLEWWRWERFRRERMPGVVVVKTEDVIDGLKGKKERMTSELEEVRMELEDMGEVMDLVLAKEGVKLDV